MFPFDHISTREDGGVRDDGAIRESDGGGGGASSADSTSNSNSNSNSISRARPDESSCPTRPSRLLPREDCPGIAGADAPPTDPPPHAGVGHALDALHGVLRALASSEADRPVCDTIDGLRRSIAELNAWSFSAANAGGEDNSLSAGSGAHIGAAPGPTYGNAVDWLRAMISTDRRQAIRVEVEMSPWLTELTAPQPLRLFIGELARALMDSRPQSLRGRGSHEPLRGPARAPVISLQITHDEERVTAIASGLGADSLGAMLDGGKRRRRAAPTWLRITQALGGAIKARCDHNGANAVELSYRVIVDDDAAARSDDIPRPSTSEDRSAA